MSWQLSQWPQLEALSRRLIDYTQQHPLVVHEMVGWYLLGSAQAQQADYINAHQSIQNGLRLSLQHIYVQEVLHGILQVCFLLPSSARHQQIMAKVAQDPRITLLARAMATSKGLNSYPQTEQLIEGVFELAEGLLHELVRYAQRFTRVMS